MISLAIDKKYAKENIVRKCVDCHPACPHSQQQVADAAHKAYDVRLPQEPIRQITLDPDRPSESIRFGGVLRFIRRAILSGSIRESRPQGA